MIGQSRKLWRGHFQFIESIEVLSSLLEIIIVSQLAASLETAVPGVDGVDLSGCGAVCSLGWRDEMFTGNVRQEPSPAQPVLWL